MTQITMTKCKVCGRSFNAVFLRCPYCKARNPERGEVSPVFASLGACVILALIFAVSILDGIGMP